jgi:murein DD-endopeptidase MepM/ murein hydrolase activator NlpD
MPGPRRELLAALSLALIALVVPAAGLAPVAAAAADARAAALARADPRWSSPLDPVLAPPRVARPFQPPPRPWLPGHRGVDLLGEAGASVYAAGDGVVAFAGLVAGKPVVSVRHGTLRTTYEPVVANVRAGDPVRRGQPIGRLVLGGSHCQLAACLHWGLLAGRAYLDPLRLLGPRGPSRLLPARVRRVSPVPPLIRSRWLL